MSCISNIEAKLMSELYALPEGWEWKRLGELAKFQSGGTPKRSEKSYWVGNIPWVKISDITDDMYVRDTEESITEEGLRNSSAKLFPKGTILYTIFATIGKIGILDIEATTNQAISGIRPKDNIDLYYMYYGLKFITNELKKVSAGVAQNNINLTKLKDQKIPLPPLQEQKRIVAKLDSLFAKIDQAIALHQQNIDEADAFMGSVLNEVFGELEGRYEKRNLTSFDPSMSSGGTPSRKEKAYWNGDIEWYSSGELNQLYTLPAKEKITSLGLKNTSTKLFTKGTLLIGMYDTAAMKMSILTNDASCNQAIVGFKSKEDELNILFVKYQLEYLKEKILEQRQGVRQKNLNLTKIKNIMIEYPPLKTQQKTVQYLDQISQQTERLKQVQQEKMQNLKDIKASILDRAFRGEI